MTRYVFPLLWFLLFAIPSPAFPKEARHQDTGSPKIQRALNFGVFPFIAQARLEKVFAPIANTISQALGTEVRYRSASSFASFTRMLEREQFDVAFIQPFDYVRLAAKVGYLPLVARSTSLTGLLIVQRHSHYQSIHDLRGQVIALPPAMAAVSYLIKSLFEEHGLEWDRDITVKHVKTHDACLHLLVLGKVQACGTAPAPLKMFEAHMPRALRTLIQSSSIPGSLFVVHSRVPIRVRQNIQNALLTMALSPSGHQLFQNEATNYFIPVVDRDYRVVRQIWEKLEPIQTFKKSDVGYSFGAFLNQPISHIERRLIPMTQDFQRALGHRVRLQTSRTPKKFYAKLAEEDFDIVLLPALKLIQLDTQGVYFPLARQNDSRTVLILVTVESDIHVLQDLQGKRIVLPGSDSTMSMVAKRALQQSGLQLAGDLTIIHTQDLVPCFKQLTTRFAEACVTTEEAWLSESNRSHHVYRVLHKIPPIPPMVIAVHSRISQQQRTQLKQNILSWPDSEAGRFLLHMGEFFPFGEVSHAGLGVVRESAKPIEEP